MSYPMEHVERVGVREAELIRRSGVHTLALLGLGPENEHFLAPGGEGLVNYRLAANVAVVLGDPLCAPEAFERVTHSFLVFCARHSWRVAFYQAYPQRLASYRSLGLRAIKIGEEALINPQSFTLSGSSMANVRSSSRRAEREGVVIHWYDGVLPAEVMSQLEQLSHAWLAAKRAAEMGFSVGSIDELSDIAERAEAIASIRPSPSVPAGVVPRLVTAVATTGGKACACVSFTPVYGDSTPTGNQSAARGWGWALDLMRRVPDAPPGVMELLLVCAIGRFQARGADTVSLGMVAMADSRREMFPGQRQLASFATQRLGLLGSRRTLLTFKQKFHPGWESRYIVASTTLALPRIALAVLRLRNYPAGGLARLVK